MVMMWAHAVMIWVLVVMVGAHAVMIWVLMVMIWAHAVMIWGHAVMIWMQWGHDFGPWVFGRDMCTHLFPDNVRV